MTHTDCFIAVSEEYATFPNVKRDVRYVGDSVAVFSGIVKETTRSTLVLAMCDPTEGKKAMTKSLFNHFTERFVTPHGAHTQFSVSFIDESAGDVVHYRCDRLSDIDAVMDEEDGKHRCCSLHASLTRPTNNAFDFSDLRLTLLFWNKEVYGDDLARVVERVASVLGIKIVSICVYFASRSTPDVDDRIALAKELKKVSEKRSFGKDEKVSSHIRLQDVRAWSLLQNEFHHFSPQVEGPHFINLNPQLIMGEKLAHVISPGISYIVGDRKNASSVDIVVFPTTSVEKEEGHRSVYSPHCRITYEGDKIHLRPECGMTYINGSLLSKETILQHNDRIILGKDIVFRFVLVLAKPKPKTSSRILDWELCCKEFDRVTKSTIDYAHQVKIEEELASMKEKCEKLQRQLQIERRDEDYAWLVLNNPPKEFHRSFVWSLGWMKTGDSVTVGPTGDIALSFLTTSAVITRVARGFTYHCDGVTVKLTHCDRFIIGDSVFSISLQSVASKVLPRKDTDTTRELEHYSENDIRTLRNGLFELQWTVAMLFDFMFPLEKARMGGKEDQVEDSFNIRRGKICSDFILTKKTLSLENITRLAESLTEAIRMVSSQLTVEIGRTAPSLEFAQRNETAESTRKTAEELFNSVNQQTKLSYDLLRRLHEAVGKALINGDILTGKSQKNTIPPLKVKNLSDLAANDVREQVMVIRSKFFIASQVIVRRMSSTIDILSMSSNPKALWERYVKVLDTLIKTHHSIATASTNKKQSVALALVDVLISMEYALTNGLLSSEEEESVADRLSSWMSIAEHCLVCFKKTAPPKRGVWSHDAAVQRKPTPHLRQASPVSGSTGVRKTPSRTGTTRHRNGSSTLSSSARQSTQRQTSRPEEARRMGTPRKSPRALRSSTPTGSSSLGKSPRAPRFATPPGSAGKGARNIPASPRLNEKRVPRLSASTSIHRTPGGTGAVRVLRTNSATATRGAIPQKIASARMNETVKGNK